MQGMMTVIPVEGEITETPLTAAPDLETLQKAVGGWIETTASFSHYRGKRCAVFFNEDGKSEGLPVNARATEDWYIAAGPGVVNDVLVGPVVIVTGDRELFEAL